MRVHTGVVESLSQLEAFCSSWDEAASNLIIAGQVTDAALQALSAVLTSFTMASLAIPNLRLGDESYDAIGLASISSGDPIDRPAEWRLSLDKSRVIESVPNGDSGIVFVTKQAFLLWSGRLSPSDLGGMKPGCHTYVVVNGLANPFGGPLLSIFPLGAEQTAVPASEISFPKEADVLKLIHVISERRLLMDTATVALTWGNREHADAAALRRLSAMVVALCMVQDVYLRENEVRVVLRGTRRVELPLVADSVQEVSVTQLDEMYAAIAWIFAEREETRHKLLTDRLSIDIREDESLMSALAGFLGDALKQARERYGFVILDRKDAYHKELRDLMKDVRAQADLYAAKVRDLVATLSRDTLAVLFMIGVSLVGRTNTSAIQGLVATTEVQVFFKVLALYFLLSILLQGVSHWRDLSMARQEGSDWHKLTREYVPENTFRDHFELPRRRRQTFFRVALGICVVVYLGLAWLSWNIASVFGAIAGIAAHNGMLSASY